ncbi:SLC39A10 [Branchiostoma lanceolatum]|uniref:SLC39A10 protein n=1 Tax=Branchiostoma lanceolatum TaxID=7740 RepID=A0A8J9YUY7_BRALA|nr:SLC39A10 [Branchiostoma lanceolatum]
MSTGPWGKMAFIHSRPLDANKIYSLVMFMALLSGLWLQLRADIVQDRRERGQHANTSVPDSVNTSDVLMAVFQKYGTADGTIDFHGFEELLTNLGLGKVQIIEEDADREHGHGKHDYATHLDLIDHHNHTTDDTDRATVGPTRDGEDEQTRRHARGHARDHKDGSEEHTAHRAGQHDHENVKHGHESAHHPVEDGAKIHGLSNSSYPDEATKSQRLHVRDSRSFLSTKVDSPAPRLVRRDVPKQPKIKHWHEPHEMDTKCLSPMEILNDFSICPVAISERQFLHICPLLITQIDSRACIQHGNNTQAVRTEPLRGRGGPGAVWGWASLAITVISLVSLLAVALVPLTTKSFYKYLITFLVALAVGCLSGDAVLHLIPHALGTHGDHNEAVPGEHGHEAGAKSADSVWKGCVVLVGIFSFFIMEKTIAVVTSARNKMQRKDRRQLQNILVKNQENFVGYKLSNTFSNEPEIEMSLMDKGVQDVHSPNHDQHGQSHIPGGHSHNHGGHSHNHGGHSHNHGGHSHNHGGHSHDMNKNAGIASVAWMVIMGDGLHNFADGVTIGAAFAESLTTGLSTSIAVFCHELPHELGDFAVLLKAGMSFKHAITYNIVSGIISFLGMAVGVGMGKSNKVGPWVFALSGGMFLYIALVDMLPELLHGSSEDGSESDDLKTTSDSACGHVLLQSAGMITGVVIMLLIAIYEDDLEKLVGQ